MMILAIRPAAKHLASCEATNLLLNLWQFTSWVFVSYCA